MRRIGPFRGFSLVETTATLSLISLIAVGVVSVADSVLGMRQVMLTTDRVDELRRAVNGNPTIIINEARTSFGYVGDMGTLPAKLEDLWVKGSQPAFAFDTTKKTGAGWNGPYVELTIREFADAFRFDEWGSPLVYDRSSFTDSALLTTALAKLVSVGPDGNLGTNDDLTMHFFENEVESRVQGFVRDDDGDPISGVNVTVNYPQNGVLTSQTDLTDATGYYFVSDIPYGNRTITIEPKLVLAEGTAITKGGNNDTVEFTLKNFAADDTTITSVTIAWTTSPASFFKELKVGGDTVYNSENPRFGDGDNSTFAGKTVTGTGQIGESIPITIQSPVTDVPDLFVGDIGKAGSIKIEMKDFVDAETGSGNKVDMTGVTFELTFSDGSVVIISPVDPNA